MFPLAAKILEESLTAFRLHENPSIEAALANLMVITDALANMYIDRFVHLPRLPRGFSPPLLDVPAVSPAFIYSLAQIVELRAGHASLRRVSPLQLRVLGIRRRDPIDSYALHRRVRRCAAHAGTQTLHFSVLIESQADSRQPGSDISIQGRQRLRQVLPPVLPVASARSSSANLSPPS